MQNRISNTSLHDAARMGDLKTLKNLIKSNPNISEDMNNLDDAGATPLLVAMQANQFHLVEILLENGAHPKASMANSLDTSLHLAARAGAAAVIVMLIQHGADINQINQQTQTPLMVATINRHLEAMNILILNGADVNFFLQISELNPDDSSSEQLEDIFISTSDSSSENEIYVEPALHVAVRYGEVEHVTLLLKNGAQIEKINAQGLTPLCVAVLVDKIEIVQLLLDHYANVLFRAVGRHESNTPLHFAALCGNEKIIALLLNYGALINMANETGATPVMIAASFDQADALKKLILHDADLHFRLSDNHNGKSILHLAAENGAQKTYKELLNYQLNDGNYKLKYFDKNNKTPFIYALENEHTDLAILIMNFGCELPNNDELLLESLSASFIDHYMINKEKHLLLIKYLNQRNWLAIKKLLLEDPDSRFYINLSTHRGNTFLHHLLIKASFFPVTDTFNRNEIKEIIKICLKIKNQEPWFGINQELQNHNGDRPIDLADSLGLEDINGVFTCTAEKILLDLFFSHPKILNKTFLDVVILALAHQLVVTKDIVSFPIQCDFCAKESKKKLFNDVGITLEIINAQKNELIVTVNLANAAQHINNFLNDLFDLEFAQFHLEIKKNIRLLRKNAEIYSKTKWGVPYQAPDATNIAAIVFALARGSIAVRTENNMYLLHESSLKAKEEGAAQELLPLPQTPRLFHNNEKKRKREEETSDAEPQPKKARR